jgi:hypothetical protein
MVGRIILNPPRDGRRVKDNAPYLKPETDGALGITRATWDWACLEKTDTNSGGFDVV